ncbi:hypothetical protein IVB11_35290 [Bradyrhizobium sp. 177]|uniref:hypothetical protein n=1 Tax=Bradyrhizobium sp. 177 TaxID=2782647 RepID=UPI001FF8039C|nr:hypothetical protein [Bradyrhizobium sp. 177]MCK1554174.1 hypothetical protein [Bradyrhizobium sp. 177]
MTKKEPNGELPESLARLLEQPESSIADLTRMIRVQLSTHNLCKRLRETFHVEQPQQKVSAPGEKERYVRACIAINTFLRLLNEEELAEKFLSLAEAVDDAKNGIPHPLVSVDKPAGKRGADPYPRTVWRILATLCTGLEMIRTVDRGLFESTITRLARRHGKRLGEITRSKRDTKASLKRWHKSFDAQTVKNEVALALYNHSVEHFRKQKDSMTGVQIRKLGEAFVEQAMEAAERLS